MTNPIFSDLISIKDYFFLIAGPCVIENEEVSFQVAEVLADIAKKYKIYTIYKASYRKANRTNINSFSGIGDLVALDLIKKIGSIYKMPTLTDIHNESEAELAAKYVDILQIPAFLCRQTDLLKAAAATGKTINIKKGQFLSANAMKFVVEKMKHFNNHNIMLTERGTMFGYNDLIVDYRNIPEMQSFKVPVILDITHSLQQPNQSTGVTGGKPALIETIAKAGIAVGVDGIFIETHPNPALAKSDGANMLKLELLDELIYKLIKLKKNI